MAELAWKTPERFLIKLNIHLRMCLYAKSLLLLLLLSHFSRVQIFVTPRTVAHQARLSMGFSKKEYWSVLPFPFPGDLPDPGIEPGSPALWADSSLSEPPDRKSVV